MSTPRVHTFPTPEPIEIEITNPAGDVRVDANGQGETRVELHARTGDVQAQETVEQAEVEFAHGRLRVSCEPRRRFGGRGRSVRVSVTAPAGSSLHTSTGSANVTVSGRIDSLDARTGSGDLAAEDVDGEARIHTASGDVALGTVAGDVWAHTASGDVRLERAGSLHVHSASGDVTVHHLGGSAEVSTAAGDVSIGRAEQGEVRVRTAAGEVSIGVAEGTLAHLDMSTVAGTLHNDLPVEAAPPSAGAVLGVRARTVSGDIRIRRAATPAGA